MLEGWKNPKKSYFGEARRANGASRARDASSGRICGWMIRVASLLVKYIVSLGVDGCSSQVRLMCSAFLWTSSNSSVVGLIRPILGPPRMVYMTLS